MLLVGRLEEVVGGAARDHWFSSSWTRIKLQEGVFQMLINLHDSSLVTTSVAVVGCREDGHDISILRPIVSLHNQLMCSGDECQAIVMVECLRDILSKRVPSSSRRYTPSASVIWVRP